MRNPDPNPTGSPPQSDASAPETPPEAPSTPDPSALDELMSQMREDYLAGDSAPVVGERYGVSVRTVRRKAAEGGWRKADTDPMLRVGAPPWGVRPHQRKVDIIHDSPEYEEIAAAREQDTLNLLFTPEPEDLQGFAFRRACEAAAMNKPAQANAWLRVQRMIVQCGPVPDPYRDAFSPDDHLRAAMLRAMGESGPETSSDDDASPNEAEG